MHVSISKESTSFSRNNDVKQQNANSVTDASFWVKFISKNSNTLKMSIVCLIKQLGYRARSAAPDGYSPLVLRPIGPTTH